MDNTKRFFANLSVIICTFKGSGRLTQTLNSLINQNLSVAEFEIIVVDNDPIQNSKIESLVEYYRDSAFSYYPQNIHYLYCPLIGLSHARNAGINQAHGEIVCFIDDDAIASPDWLSIIEKTFRDHPQAGVIGGHILLKIPDPRPKILKLGFEVFWSQFITNFTEYTKVGSWDDFPWGANWCARKDALTQIGGFKTTYGRTGENYWGGEELAAAYEIRKLGYSIGIEPRSMVLHCVDPKRFNLS